MYTFSLLLFIGASIYQAHSQGSLPHVTCARTYTKLGCFQEKATTMDMIINDRDVTSPYHQGYLINWKEFKESTHSLVCRCASKAKSMGYAYIAIRFWGECHAGRKEADLTAMIVDPKKKSNQCASPKFTACVDTAEEECVGKASADYIYSLIAKSEAGVNGGYSDWTEYSDCSATCGNGVQTRERTCTNPVPKGSGKDCAELGESTETRVCKIVECPVDGGFTPWSEFSACDKTCGGGAQTRSRFCIEPAPAFGGDDCVGPAFERRECNTSPCPVDGDYGPWTEFGACSTSCGAGTQQSTRECKNPAPANGGRDCAHLGPAVQTQACEVRKCPVNGGFGPWGEYGACSVTCGEGFRSRTRQCNNPTPAYGGNDCANLGPSEDKTTCNLQACPASEFDRRVCEYQQMQLSCTEGVIEIISANYGRLSKDFCGFQSWWSTNCRASASNLKMAQLCDGKKSCLVDASNSVFGDPCIGTVKYLEVKHRCKAVPPPVNGGFGTWSDYGACSVTCGRGVQQRSRECNNPVPAYGGTGCIGVVAQSRSCEEKGCPVNGNYGGWSSYGACSVSCGGGFQSRTRQCNNPTPSNGGDDCKKLGPSEDKSACNTHACPPRYGPEVESRACEWSKLEIKCNDGVIDIVSANYGRTSSQQCGYLFWYQLSCRSKNSSSKVAEMCNGKSTCAVQATNAVFGDPCIGTVKYLEVRHRCRLS